MRPSGYTDLSAMEITQREIAPGAIVVTVAGKVMMGTESQQIVTLVEGFQKGRPRR